MIENLEDPQFKSILLNTAKKLVEDTAQAQGLSCDFVVSVSPLLNSDATISAGFPPTITLRSMFLADFVFGARDQKEFERNKIRLRRNIATIVSRIPRMEKTLSNNPPAELIAFVSKDNKWYKTNVPERFTPVVPDSFIETKEVYTVTMREINTDISVTLSGENPSYLRAKCKEELISLVSSQQVLLSKLKLADSAQEIESISLKFSADENASAQVAFNYKAESNE